MMMIMRVLTRLGENWIALLLLSGIFALKQLCLREKDAGRWIAPKLKSGFARGSPKFLRVRSSNRSCALAGLTAEIYPVSAFSAAGILMSLAGHHFRSIPQLMNTMRNITQSLNSLAVA
ncbi:hypothetical protein B1812_06200 [Methylocystis bryophila]|uniref:Uncharacterized protein n=1 Tax=Methylocystis bryophila TaxID=655015 RepID=A0A1W6MT53_9HYPH|nr:hypothetical protein B1812_06200 [Methylocystis bryophila]